MTTTVRARFDPPAPSLPSRTAAQTAFAAALRARPGAWALMGQHASPGSARQFAYTIHTGRLGAFRPAGAFEADAKTVMGEHRVYARYVGQDAAPSRGEVTGR